MEGIVLLVLAGLVLYLIYLFIVYVILPISGILLVIALGSSVCYAFFTSISSFITSLNDHINPYKTYVDTSPGAPPGIKRNYFFGPGYHQISITIKDAFELQEKRLTELGAWVDANAGYLNPWYINIWYWIFHAAAYFSTFVLGYVWVAVFSVTLSVVLFAGMCGFYIFFMALWTADRLSLIVKSIQSRCPRCKRISIVPVFICPDPDCGYEHRNLTPGPYGIFKRKCLCGKYLSTTYFNGRSKYEAICPKCGHALAASDAQQVGIQLVGGVSTGKTTFLAAFWHEYLAKLKGQNNIIYTLSPEDAFAELEDWFEHGSSAATAETNANMYSLILEPAEKTKIQLAIYDIAGEAFTSLRNDVQQQQFQYCAGIIFVVDPTADPVSIAETASNFINEYENLTGKRSTKMSKTSVAVIISKADIFKKEIGFPKIRATFDSEPQRFADSEGVASYELARNSLCRDFLKNRGHSNTLNVIDGSFSNVQYYPVSAMGHPASPARKYEPWGVMEPVIWLLQQQNAVSKEYLQL